MSALVGEGWEIKRQLVEPAIARQAASDLQTIIERGGPHIYPYQPDVPSPVQTYKIANFDPEDYPDAPNCFDTLYMYKDEYPSLYLVLDTLVEAVPVIHERIEEYNWPTDSFSVNIYPPYSVFEGHSDRDSKPVVVVDVLEVADVEIREAGSPERLWRSVAEGDGLVLHNSLDTVFNAWHEVTNPTSRTRMSLVV